MKSGDNIPPNFGVGLPWHNLLGLYNIDNSFSDFWWSNINLTNPPYTNRPTVAGADYALSNVELVRHSKTPYMLQSVKKQVWGPGGTVTDFDEGAWQDVSNHQFEYQIEQVRKGTIFETNEWVTPPGQSGFVVKDCYGRDTGKRNIVVLTSIKQLPVDGESNGDLTTTLTYEIIGGASIPPGPNYGNGLNTGFALLKSIVNPLGKRTTISYAPIDFAVNSTFCIPTSSFVQSGSHSYILPTYQKRYFPTASSLCGSGGSPCQTSTTIQTKPYTNQIFFVVADISIEDREGEKKYYYFFNDPHILHRMPGLNDHFARDDRYSYQLGFGHTSVRGPVHANTSSTIRTEYRHHSDNLLWGKLYEVKSYDANSTLLSESNINYESLMAFEPPTNRVIRNAAGNWTDYFEYKEDFGFSDGRPVFNDDFYAYNAAMEQWILENEPNYTPNSQEYDDWLADRPQQPYVTCFDCDECGGICNDDADDCIIPQNILSSCGCDYVYENNLTNAGLALCENYWQDIYLWYQDRPANDIEFSIMFDPMYDSPPNFYESQYSKYIENADPTYLYSFFVKKTSESQTTYDQNCRSGSGAITSNTSYEYYDADYRGLSSSGGYAAMGGYNSSIGLFWEPSWQLYKKESSSPQAPGISTTEEYFYLWDLINQDEYQQSNSLEPDPNFKPLWFNWAWRKARNFPIETRITKTGGGGSNTRSTYYVYDTQTELTYEERTVTYLEDTEGVFPCGDPIPPGNTPSNTGQTTGSQNDLPAQYLSAAVGDPSTIGNSNNGAAESVFNYRSYLDDETQGLAVITLNGKVMLKKVIEQVSPYMAGGQQPIVNYNNASFQPTFPSTVDRSKRNKGVKCPT